MKSAESKLGLNFSSFGYQFGATIVDNAIQFDGSGEGIVVYGPYIFLGPGLFIFSLDLKIADDPHVELEVEIYSNGIVYAVERISTHCTQLVMSACLDVRCPVEVRIRSSWTAFKVYQISYSQVKNLSIANTFEVRQSTIISLLELFANTTSDPSRAWMDEGEVRRVLFAKNAIRSISLAKLQDHAIPLRSLGIDSAAIKSIFDMNFSKVNEDQSLNAEKLTQGYPFYSNRFQEDILKSGVFEVISPYTGKLAATKSSIPVAASHGVISIVYEFLEEKPFVVGVSNGWSGSIGFIWFVGQDVIIYTDVGSSTWVSAEDVIVKYVSLCGQNLKILRQYRQSAHELALCSGFIGNLGHYFWNDISGLERMRRLGGFDQVKRIFARTNQWLRICRIFDNFNAAEFTELSSLDDLFVKTLENNLLIVRPTGNSIDAELALAINSASALAFKAENPARYELAKSLCEGNPYVLFVNLRVHNKSWLEQEEGICRITEFIATKIQFFDRILVYLDGMPDCASSAELISQRGNSQLQYIDGTRVSFSESLFWAYQCNNFLAIIGSGLVPLTWLANKRGVCYSDKRHLGQLDWWRSVRRDGATLLAPEASDIHDVVDVFYSNFSLSPDLILGLFASLFDDNLVY